MEAWRQAPMVEASSILIRHRAQAQARSRAPGHIRNRVLVLDQALVRILVHTPVLTQDRTRPAPVLIPQAHRRRLIGAGTIPTGGLPRSPQA
jgi:hypothetical protein